MFMYALILYAIILKINMLQNYGFNIRGFYKTSSTDQVSLVNCTEYPS